MKRTPRHLITLLNLNVLNGLKSVIPAIRGNVIRSVNTHIDDLLVEILINLHDQVILAMMYIVCGYVTACTYNRLCHLPRRQVDQVTRYVTLTHRGTINLKQSFTVGQDGLLHDSILTLTGRLFRVLVSLIPLGLKGDERNEV